MKEKQGCLRSVSEWKWLLRKSQKTKLMVIRKLSICSLGFDGFPKQGPAGICVLWLESTHQVMHRLPAGRGSSCSRLHQTSAPILTGACCSIWQTGTEDWEAFLTKPVWRIKESTSRLDGKLFLKWELAWCHSDYAKKPPEQCQEVASKKAECTHRPSHSLRFLLPPHFFFSNSYHYLSQNISE